MSTTHTSVPNFRVTERDATFFAAARVVRKTGSYPLERAIVVLGQLGLLAGVLVVGILLTAVLGMYVHKAASAIVFLALCLGIVFGVMPYIEKRLWATRAALAYLVTRQLIAGEAGPSAQASESATRFLREQFGDLGPIADAHNEVQRLVSKFFRTFDRLGEVLPVDIEPRRRPGSSGQGLRERVLRTLDVL